jgi:hypothetical protein
MTESPPPADIGSVLRALVQQQTALLQVHAESVRLQRVLIEQLLGKPGEPSVAATMAALEPLPPIIVDSVGAPPAPSPPTAPVAPPSATSASSPTSAAAQPVPDVATASPPEQLATAPSPSRAALYYQARPQRTSTAPAAVQPHDLELMRRLHEMGDASRLILQFGPHKGSTLAQVAMSDPDYVRQLVNRAQRPEVRAAAGRLVEALEAASAHKPRAARGSSRRSRT